MMRSSRGTTSLVTTLVAAAALGWASEASATQETFTTAGPLNCSAVSYCVQNTSDNLFTLTFVPTYPTSGPSSTGYNVNEASIEISAASGGVLDMSIVQIALTGSEFYNGMNFLGAIQLEVQDTAGNWRYLTQWSTYVGSSKAIYVMFNGKNAQSPVVKGVKAVRFTGINGATAFRIGMLTATAR